MAKAFGIVTSTAPYIKVEGMQEYRPIGAFSFVGRYRLIDFPISNMSNSGIDRIQVYVDSNPRSLVEHLGSGRHYNINSKRGKLQMLFPHGSSVNEIYNTDISAFNKNLEIIDRMQQSHVVIAPSNFVYAQDYDALLDEHVESGADITMLYQRVDNAKESFLNCNVLNLNKQKGVLSIDRNVGNTKEKLISLDTYVMKKELFIDLIKAALKESSMFNLADIVSLKASELDIRGVAHRGYVAAVTDFKSYYRANMSLIDHKTALDLFSKNWTFYTRTSDSCPTQYFEDANVRNSMISNGCLIEGTVENCVIGRGVKIRKGAVVKDSVILSYAEIGPDVHIEGQVVDKWAKIVRTKEICAQTCTPGYIRRNDTL
jgi:glucose-1-phosphate adenylyltransferase